MLFRSQSLYHAQPLMMNLRRPHSADAYQLASFSAPIEVDGPMLGGEGNIGFGGGAPGVPRHPLFFALFRSKHPV